MKWIPFSSLLSLIYQKLFLLVSWNIYQHFKNYFQSLKQIPFVFNFDILKITKYSRNFPKNFKNNWFRSRPNLNKPPPFKNLKYQNKNRGKKKKPTNRGVNILFSSWVLITDRLFNFIFNFSRLDKGIIWLFLLSSIFILVF